MKRLSRPATGCTRWLTTRSALRRRLTWAASGSRQRQCAENLTPIIWILLGQPQVSFHLHQLSETRTLTRWMRTSYFTCKVFPQSSTTPKRRRLLRKWRTSQSTKCKATELLTSRRWRRPMWKIRQASHGFSHRRTSRSTSESSKLMQLRLILTIIRSKSPRKQTPTTPSHSSRAKIRKRSLKLHH